MSNIIKPNHEYLVYRGRYDNTNIEEPVFGFPLSGIAIYFEGPSLSILIKNKHYERENYIGVLLDGKQLNFQLGKTEEAEVLTVATDLEEIRHEAFIYKRMDLCHEIAILGFDLGDRGKILAPRKEPRKRIEFLGDSITSGEYVGAKRNIFTENTSNAYYSYAAIVGRLMHARVNLVSQSGLPFMDGLGGFICDGNRIGMETLFDKASFSSRSGTGAQWNHNKFIPHVVVVALGQYDQYPEDFMKEDLNSEKSLEWKRRYKAFVTKLRKQYPNALLVLVTSVCVHSPRWDRAIGQVCTEINDTKTVHFLYNENGRAADEFVNIAQSEEMALELNSFLRGFDESIWNG